jgi:putative Mg2+ transporter-C (MgtC) family protein
MLHDLTALEVGRLLFAALLGGVVGLERELARRPAGIRTNMLISLGAALFTIVSFQMASTFPGDHTRIAAQIIPGIGFIGAGMVIRERGTVIGITSAATLFVVASIGMAVGAGLLVTGLFTTLLLLGSLVIVGNLEQRFGLHAQLMSFRIAAAAPDTVERVRRIVDQAGVRTRNWKSHRTDEGFLVELEAEITQPQERDLTTRLGALHGRIEARIVPPVTPL